MISDPFILIGMSSCRFASLPHKEQEGDRKDHSDRERQPCDPGTVKQSRKYVTYERDARNRYRIRKLCLNMIDMIAVRTRRRHDGRIGNGRAVITADRTCKTG